MMAEQAPRAVYTGDEVIRLLDEVLDDGGLDDIFPDSDDELGFQDEIEDEK